jgi:hypothetical protein
MIDIKRAVSNENTVEFQYYFDGSLWYKEISGVVFPVPVEDIGTATFNRTEKALLMMRYMRKYNKMKEESMNTGA